MVLTININGLVKISCMTLNISNSRYAVSPLHQFSACCKERVGHRKYCKGCGKELTNTEILKGISSDVILSNEQVEELKEFLENGNIDVVNILTFSERDLITLIPYIQNTKVLLPSISKGYKKTDIKTFFSFKEALSEANKVCLVKFVQRAVEHLGILIVLGEDLMFLELPFKHYHNMDEIKRMKEQVNSIIEIDKINPLQFKKEASDFLKNYKTKEKTITKNNLFAVTEEKKILMNKFIEEIISGKVKNTPKREIKSEVNPFSK